MIRAAVFVLAFWAVPPSARAQCEITGVASLERLRLRIHGERLRTLAVTDLPIAVRPGDGRYLDVRVLSPLSFTARSDAEIPWTVPRASTFAGGMLWLTPEIEIEQVIDDEERNGVVVRARIDDGVWISRLRMPCDALTLGRGESAAPPRWGLQGGPRWQPLRSTLWVSSQPGEGESVRIDAPNGLPEHLIEVAREGDFIRIVGRFASGAILRGWVRQHHLRPAPNAPATVRAFQRSAPARRNPECARNSRHRDEYVGPAQVVLGTPVHTRPDGTIWATITEPARVTIAWRTSAPWARIVHATGLHDDGRCPEVLHGAWVPRSAVRLQGEEGSR